MSRSRLPLLLLLAALPFTLAGQHARLLAPGEYIGLSGNALLQIQPVGADGQPFFLSSVGPNGHTCTLEGVIRAGKAILESDPGEEACQVGFDAQADGSLEVSSNLACRHYCGMRGYFDGDYRLPAPGCDSAALAQTRKAASEALARGAFVETRAALNPLLTQCEATLSWFDSIEIRNQLGEAAAGLGEREQCREALGELYEDLHDPDAHMLKQLPPMEYEIYRDALAKARTTATRCGLP